MSKPRKTLGATSSKVRGKNETRKKEVAGSNIPFNKYPMSGGKSAGWERDRSRAVHGSDSEFQTSASTEKKNYGEALQSNKDFMVRHSSALKKLSKH